MERRVRLLAMAWMALSLGLPASGQQTEASAGFSLQGTLSVLGVTSTTLSERPGNSDSLDGGVRLMLYPAWKLSRHWIVSGAYQVVTTPYYYSTFALPGHGARGSIVQANLSYSQVWNNASLQVRAGELASAFGAFPLRYDDNANALVDLPMQYGYYGSPATLSALAGVQAEGTWKRLDARAQFVNSSPANPRSIFASEQYGSWAGGGGVTVRQGLRFGVSGYSGLYLDRQSRFYYQGEAPPRDLPASGIGIDGQWGRGHWNVRGEWQRFVMAYKAIPTFHERAGYLEVQRSLGPRWYGAARFGDLTADYVGRIDCIETVVGYRPAAGQVVRLSFEVSHSAATATTDRTLAVQFVTAIHPASFARH